MKTFVLILPIAAGMMLAASSLSAQTADALQIEARSTYRPVSERTPFWPIGWKPVLEETVITAAQPKSAEDTSFFVPARFNVTSISIGRLPLALINGRAYSEGDLVPISTGGGLNAEVTAVRDGEVDLRFRGKTISIPLKVRPLRGQEQQRQPSGR